MEQQKNDQCPNGHGTMLRCFVKPTIDGKQVWKKIAWQHCHVCGVTVPDK